MNPDTGDVTLVHTITQSNGDEAPSFITTTENSGTQTLDVSIKTTNAGDVGEYELMLVATATHLNE